MKNRLQLLLFYFKFLLTKRNTLKSYLHFRRAYMVFHLWRWFDFLNKTNKYIKGKYKIKKSFGILGELDQNQASKIITQINKNGYFVFEKVLPNLIVDKIYEFAFNTPINYLVLNKNNEIDFSEDKKKYSENKNNSIRHQFTDILDLVDFNIVRNIVFDQNFLHIANEYLETKPILDIITLWWSRPLNVIPKKFNQAFKSTSAQMFHYDLDRLKFIKFFIYLTDVNLENGPHVYVRESHLKPSFFIKNDGRYEDEFISSIFADKIVNLCGKKGTIIAVDTRGIHKGLELINGERLLFQVQFTNSLFGSNNLDQYEKKYTTNDSLIYKDVYKLFFKFK